MSSRIKWTRCRALEPDGVRCPVINWGETYCSFHKPKKGPPVVVVETFDEATARIKKAVDLVRGMNALMAEGHGMPAPFLDRVSGLQDRPGLKNEYKARVILEAFSQMSPSVQELIQTRADSLNSNSTTDAPSEESAT